MYRNNDYQEFNATSGIKTTTNYFARIFGWVFAALGLTAAIATGVYYLLAAGIIPVESYYGLLIGSTIAYLILMIVIQVRILRRRATGKSLTIPFVLYTIVMGITLSTYLIYFEIPLLLTAFGITALTFGVMALYGALTKRNLNVMGMIAVSAMMGAFGLALFNLFMRSESIYWLVSFVMFGAVMLITAFDTWQMKNEITLGRMNDTTAMYFAFRLYVDFIYLFVRIVSFLAAGRRN